MQENREERAISLAEFIIANQATVRCAAKHFSVSKSTVHKDVTEGLRHLHPNLYQMVKQILEKNKSERHLRGGEATKQKYRLQSKTPLEK